MNTQIKSIELQQSGGTENGTSANLTCLFVDHIHQRCWKTPSYLDVRESRPSFWIARVVCCSSWLARGGKWTTQQRSVEWLQPLRWRRRWRRNGAPPAPPASHRPHALNNETTTVISELETQVYDGYHRSCSGRWWWVPSCWPGDCTRRNVSGWTWSGGAGYVQKLQVASRYYTAALVFRWLP